MREWPILLVAAVVITGLVGVALDHWRYGSLVIGVGLLLAGGLRLTLRERQAGLLVVRSRTSDAAALLVLGFALVALANTIPAARL
ncbi:MAG: DUF3017 domain-containing protein [Actinobacteria bacterium]|nr:DUF3017 domain-containing protein [Actinomycetota bacterium]MCA1721842.1 DUF3017 domain-containing protein [Actinomycetota bacterium]